jgi:hypothetical protein
MPAPMLSASYRTAAPEARWRCVDTNLQRFAAVDVVVAQSIGEVSRE